MRFFKIAVCFFAVCAYVLGAEQATYQKISAEKAYQIMQTSNDYILLDVRSAEEFKTKRIKGAILIPQYELKERAKAELRDKNKMILVYCRSGGRSRAAAEILADLGYKNVYDFGGIVNWEYETISGDTL
ncbi:MAG: rhodanese-like domain-containing protein [Helicobacteraceae bacterium]|jgi:rhodanese-related sulfurtransferase|nr:rhodanese-like domain-containing protein [Helicobacteraceae bacterium]